MYLQVPYPALLPSFLEAKGKRFPPTRSTQALLAILCKNMPLEVLLSSIEHLANKSTKLSIMKSIRRTSLVIYLCCTPLATAFNAAIVHAKRSSALEMHAEDHKSDVDTSRRSVFASALAAYSVIASPFAANAVYGADANIQMPNVAQGMADRLEKQKVWGRLRRPSQQTL